MSETPKRRHADLDVALGKVIQKRRLKRGLTQAQLAQNAGVRQGYVSFLERGLQSPSIRSLTLLATALGTLPSSLIRAAERMCGFPPPTRHV
jgi:transcriptional regulator with XRE-family HTH domain